MSLSTMTTALKAVFNDLTGKTADVKATETADAIYNNTDASGQVIGEIKAWHKSFPNTPALSSEWLECNGQVVSDADSPYNGQTLPNLNGLGHFLRGSSVSGTVQADAMQGHKHSGAIEGALTTFNPSAGGGVGSTTLGSIGNPTTDGVNGTPRTAAETRPVNMSVVWIIRIK